MKQWFSLTCPVCGFRYPLKKFKPSMKPIHYPLQVVTGGGRAKGFKVLEYLPWASLPTLTQTDIRTSLLCLYDRLGAAYDHFYETLGFMSPKMNALLQALRGSYANVYRASPYENYHKVFSPIDSAKDIVESYSDDDYSRVYAQFLANPSLGGIKGG
jgi:hypothetical protein